MISFFESVFSVTFFLFLHNRFCIFIGYRYFLLAGILFNSLCVKKVLICFKRSILKRAEFIYLVNVELFTLLHLDTFIQ